MLIFILKSKFTIAGEVPGHSFITKARILATTLFKLSVHPQLATPQAVTFLDR